MRRMATGAALSAGVLSVLSSQAHAENLIVVTADRISVRDSASLSTERDGLPFTLPAGFAAVGADADPDDGDVNILARNATSGLCRVFEGGDPGDADDSLPLIADSPTVACPVNVGDLEFIRSRSGDDFGWTFASGATIQAFQPGDSAYEVLPVSSSSGTEVDLAALGFQGVDNVTRQRAISRNGSGALADVGDSDTDGSSGTGLTLNTVRALSGAVLSGATSFDISENTGAMFLLTSGTVYTLNDNGAATALGTAPLGTVAVFVDLSESASGGGNGSGGGGGGGGSGDDEDEEEGSGDIKVGAFSWSLLVPLVLLASLRRLLAGRSRARIRQ